MPREIPPLQTGGRPPAKGGRWSGVSRMIVQASKDVTEVVTGVGKGDEPCVSG